MKSVLSFFLIFISFGTLFSQSNGSPLLDSIAKSISLNKNLTIVWETSFLSGKDRVVKQNLAKIKGKKYYHQAGPVTIICDVEMVYKKIEGSKAVISHCDTTVDYNPIKTLTFFGEGFIVNKITRNKSKMISLISIKTIDKEANIIQEAFLYFDEKGTLSGITFKTSGDFVNYVKILKLDSSIVLKDSEFEIPK